MINYIKQEKSVIIFVSNLLHSLFETEVAYYTKYQWQQSAKKCKDVYIDSTPCFMYLYSYGYPFYKDQLVQRGIFS